MFPGAPGVPIRPPGFNPLAIQGAPAGMHPGMALGGPPQANPAAQMAAARLSMARMGGRGGAVGLRG